MPARLRRAVRFAIAMGFRDVADRGGFRYVPGKSSRQAIHDWVFDRYRTLWPDAEIFESEGPEGPPNRAAMRNHAIGAAFEMGGADVVLNADADVVPCFGPITEGLQSIERFPDKVKWVTPYTEYVKAGRTGSRKIMAGVQPSGLKPSELGWRTNTGTAGLMLITREAWETVGGYDETFTGWGWEDDAIVVALETLVHGVTKVTGTCVHLEHERSRTRVKEKKAMEPLFWPYDGARGNPEAMVALLRERGVLA